MPSESTAMWSDTVTCSTSLPRCRHFHKMHNHCPIETFPRHIFSKCKYFMVFRALDKNCTLQIILKKPWSSIKIELIIITSYCAKINRQTWIVLVILVVNGFIFVFWKMITYITKGCPITGVPESRERFWFPCSKTLNITGQITKHSNVLERGNHQNNQGQELDFSDLTFAFATSNGNNICKMV